MKNSNKYFENIVTEWWQDAIAGRYTWREVWAMLMGMYAFCHDSKESEVLLLARIASNNHPHRGWRPQDGPDAQLRRDVLRGRVHDANAFSPRKVQDSGEYAIAVPEGKLP